MVIAWLVGRANRARAGLLAGTVGVVLAGCGSSGAGQPVSLSFENDSDQAAVVRLSGPTVPATAFRVEAGSTAVLIVREQPEGSDPTVMLRALSPDCAFLGQEVISLTGHVLVRLTDAPTSMIEETSAPAPLASPILQLEASQACPDTP